MMRTLRDAAVVAGRGWARGVLAVDSPLTDVFSKRLSIATDRIHGLLLQL